MNKMSKTFFGVVNLLFSNLRTYPVHFLHTKKSDLLHETPYSHPKVVDKDVVTLVCSFTSPYSVTSTFDQSNQIHSLSGEDHVNLSSKLNMNNIIRDQNDKADTDSVMSLENDRFDRILL